MCLTRGSHVLDPVFCSVQQSPAPPSMVPLSRVVAGQKRSDRAEETVADQPKKKKKARRGTTKPRERDFDDLVDGHRRHNLNLLEQALGEKSIGM